MLVELEPKDRLFLARWFKLEWLDDNTTIVVDELKPNLVGLLPIKAYTWNKTIYLTPRAPRKFLNDNIDTANPEWIKLIAHELIHVEQQEELGWWWFLASYITRFTPLYWKEPWRHPLEKRAYDFEKVVGKALEDTPR